MAQVNRPAHTLVMGEGSAQGAGKEVKPQDKALSRNKWQKYMPISTSKETKHCRMRTTPGPKIPSDAANARNLPVGIMVTAEYVTYFLTLSGLHVSHQQ